MFQNSINEFVNRVKANNRMIYNYLNSSIEKSKPNIKPNVQPPYTPPTSSQYIVTETTSKETSWHIPILIGSLIAAPILGSLLYRSFKAPDDKKDMGSKQQSPSLYPEDKK